MAEVVLYQKNYRAVASRTWPRFRVAWQARCAKANKRHEKIDLSHSRLPTEHHIQANEFQEGNGHHLGGYRLPPVRRPKSGAGVSWPAAMMPRRISRARLKRSNSVSPSPQRIARWSADRSSEKRPRVSSTASLLLRKTSRHMVGSDAAMRVKSR